MVAAGCIFEFADEVALYEEEVVVRVKHCAGGEDENTKAEGAEDVVGRWLGEVFDGGGGGEGGGGDGRSEGVERRDIDIGVEDEAGVLLEDAFGIVDGRGAVAVGSAGELLVLESGCFVLRRLGCLDLVHGCTA